MEILLSQGVFTYEASIRNCSSGVSNSSSSCAGVKSVSIMIAVVGIHAMGESSVLTEYVHVRVHSIVMWNTCTDILVHVRAYFVQCTCS